MADIEKVGDRYYLRGPEAVLELANLREHHDGMTAEVTATILTTGAQTWARVNLASSISRAQYCKALAPLAPGLPWGAFVDLAARLTVAAERAGDPSVPLRRRPPSADRWLVPGWFPLGETSVVFGDGGTGKSLFAMALALAGLTGRPLAGRWRVAPLTKVLYLDWESQEEDHAERLWGLTTMSGDGDGVEGIQYLAMRRSLAESMPAIRREAEGADLVIVDSLGAATGGVAADWHDSAVRMMNALRQLGPACSRLLIAHVTKVAADSTGPSRPFGSAYISNLARSTVEVRRHEDDEPGAESMAVTYYHRKVNRGALSAPMALRYLFDSQGHIGVQPGEADLSHAGIPAQILGALRPGARTVTAISEETGIPANSLRKVLSRMEKRDMVSRIEESPGGRGRETLWGRKDRYRDPARYNP